ncbi:hypothetical protein [Microbacterium sp. 2MCAF23]|uniref:hypothetical protein n=1 Tax=Microbacterium sp. 2MCAF23 TaxID=3232985 RepID=UPI003F96F244
MIETLFIVADAWLMFVCLVYGWKFIRRHHNYLLGIEWIIVGVSATNFLVWSLLGGDPASPMYTVAYFLDAFSRSFGFTLVLILGLRMATHHYKPTLWVEIGAFVLAVAGGAFLVSLHHGEVYDVGPATFFVLTNLITSIFLFSFAGRLWRAGSKGWSVATTLITLVAMVIALTYDLFPWPFDDAQRTYFYTAALATWGTQGFIYYFGYTALSTHNARIHASAAQRVAVSS